MKKAILASLLILAACSEKDPLLVPIPDEEKDPLLTPSPEETSLIIPPAQSERV